jgi:hypothetical protein
MSEQHIRGMPMLKFFGNTNQSVTDYVEGLDLELPDDLTALNPGLVESPHPAPAVEVHEVNDDAVWELWHDSVAFQDSQFADGLADETQLQTQSTPLDVVAPFVDAFSSVHKKSQ